jgi:hypothetical protein
VLPLSDNSGAAMAGSGGSAAAAARTQGEGPAVVDGEEEGWERVGHRPRSRNARAAQNGQPAAAARRRAPRVLVEPLRLDVLTPGGTAQNQHASLMFAVFAAQGPTGKDHAALDGRALASSLGSAFAAAMRSAPGLSAADASELDSLLESVRTEPRGVGAFASGHGQSASYRFQITMPVALHARATAVVVGKGSMLHVSLPERGDQPIAAMLCRGPASRMQECMLVEMTPLLSAALQAQAAPAADVNDWANCNASPVMVPDVTPQAALQALHAVPGMGVSWVGQAAQLGPAGARFVGVQWGAEERGPPVLSLPVTSVRIGGLYALVYGPGVPDLLPRRLNGAGLQHKAISWQVRTEPSPVLLSVSALLYRVSLPVPPRTVAPLPAGATWGSRPAPAGGASAAAAAGSVPPGLPAGIGSSAGPPTGHLPAAASIHAAVAPPAAQEGASGVTLVPRQTRGGRGPAGVLPVAGRGGRGPGGREQTLRKRPNEGWEPDAVVRRSPPVSEGGGDQVAMEGVTEGVGAAGPGAGARAGDVDMGEEGSQRPLILQPGQS